MRADDQPVSAPACRRELAKAASSGGPSACTARQRSATCPAGPASRQTCKPAVLVIMTWPYGLYGEKASAIAV
jgi:hypothetical protein